MHAQGHINSIATETGGAHLALPEVKNRQLALIGSALDQNSLSNSFHESAIGILCKLPA